MGTTGALGFAEQVSEGNIDLRAALHWHLTANHFPAIDPVWIDVAIEAIEVANHGFEETVLDRPDGFNGEKQYITAIEVIEGLHLESFIDSDWE